MSPLPNELGGAPLASAVPGISALRIAPPLTAAPPAIAPAQERHAGVAGYLLGSFTDCAVGVDSFEVEIKP